MKRAILILVSILTLTGAAQAKESPFIRNELAIDDDLETSTVEIKVPQTFARPIPVKDGASLALLLMDAIFTYEQVPLLDLNKPETVNSLRYSGQHIEDLCEMKTPAMMECRQIYGAGDHWAARAILRLGVERGIVRSLEFASFERE